MARTYQCASAAGQAVAGKAETLIGFERLQRFDVHTVPRRVTDYDRQYA